MRKRIDRPSPALVISVIALVVAVAGGGSAIADGVARAAKLITGSQIKNGSVTSADVKDGSLLRSDFKASERARLIGPEGNDGPTGKTGPQGPQGAAGAPGAPGAAGPPGTARAYGLVSDTGGLSRQKNINGVVKIADGTYCVQLDASINASTAVATLTQDVRTVTTGAVLAIDPQAEACGGAPNSIGVVTTHVLVPDPPDPGTEVDEEYQDQGFFIIVG